MSTNLYLKKQLATNVPQRFRMKKRAGSYPETDYNTKQPTGKMEFLYIFTDAKGQELKHYAKEREEETLKLFNPGEQMQVVLQETMKQTPTGEKRISFLVWTPPEGAEARAAATPQIRTNTAETRQERRQDAYQEAQQAKDVSITLLAFSKSLIESGIQDPQKVSELSRQLYALHRQDVNAILSLDNIDPFPPQA